MTAARSNPTITIDVMGRRQRVPFSGTEAELARLGEGQRQFARKQRSALAQARALVTATDINAAVEAVSRYSMMLSSDRRLSGLIEALCDAPAAVFWRVLLEEWDVCDNTHACLPELLMLIRHHIDVGDNPSAHWPAEAHTFLRTLLPVVTVYRGCSRQRVNGISWTLDRSVAETFARGHRGIAVPDPVIVTGTIARDRILAVFTERNEREVLLDPRDLKDGAVSTP